MQDVYLRLSGSVRVFPLNNYMTQTLILYNLTGVSVVKSVGKCFKDSLLCIRLISCITYICRPTRVVFVFSHTIVVQPRAHSDSIKMPLTPQTNFLGFPIMAAKVYASAVIMLCSNHTHELQKLPNNQAHKQQAYMYVYAYTP